VVFCFAEAKELSPLYFEVGVGVNLGLAHAGDYFTVALLLLALVITLGVIKLFANNWVVDFVLDADVLDLLKLLWA